ncbi:UDP-glucuronosyltransferase 1-6-like [Polyodon spathula]|uniref:UDP-glucuronosyltransferase 1-6-like n=1 Tax=Polyodon spathula TaxID=7913 RepID=UPI001B7E1674|nr:UDP-glucuronosyltransferase 1-6-like [Polyodon spathula]
MALPQGSGQCLAGGLLTLLFLRSLDSVQGGKLLVVPMDGSHWISMKVVVEELGRKGHQVVVVIPEASLLLGPSNHCTTKTFAVPYTQEYVKMLHQSQKEAMFDRKPFLEKISSVVTWLQIISNFTRSTSESLLYNTELMQYLKEQEFDAVFTDPVIPTGAIVAEYLSLPSVYMLRGTPCGLEFTATQCPSPPSYVPRFFTRNTDRMTFAQRGMNFLVSLLEPLFCKFVYYTFDDIASRFLQRDITVVEMMSRASVWLLRLDFTLEFPRPLMPNMVLIGGINCGVQNSLPVELEEFVNSSGEHGFVVFTLGSMISEMPLKKVNQFAEALGKIPQKVIWRLTGPTPGNLSANIKLMKWLPQNDLLAHPKARAFMTHGGTHGIYEGICNGVPMVMLPLFGDQADNVQRMASRGVGVVLSIHDMTSQSLLDALNTVINDKSYKENMMRLSAAHKDRPIEPLDLAVHWTEFVMRHKGAEHLRLAAHDLNWIQYHCLDVIGLLVVIVIAVTLVMVKICMFCFRKCYGRSRKKRKSE